MPQQTAVDWLVDQIKNVQNQKRLSAHEWMKIIIKAKDMEKKQIMIAAYDGMGLGFDSNMGRAELYYEENYTSIP